MSQSQEQLGFSFPLLKNGEILQCLAELSIALSEEELLKPTAEQMLRVLSEFVERLTNIQKQDLGQEVFEAKELLQYPELHEMSIPEIEMLRKIIHMVQVSGIMDFSASDILKPVYKRTKRILSAIINFAKFREERLPQYEELTAQQEHLFEEKAVHEAQLHQKENQLRTLIAQQKHEQPMVLQLQQECEEYSVRISEYNKEQAALQAEGRELKQNIKEIQDDIANDKFNILNVQSDKMTLQDQIIENPEKMVEVIDTLGEKVEEEKEAVADFVQKEKDLVQQMELLERMEAEMTECIRVMQKTEAEMDKLSKTEKQVKSNNEHVEDAELQIREYSKNEAHMGRLIQSNQEKLFRLQTQRQAKEEAATQALEQIQEEREQLETENTKIMGQIETISAQTKELQTEHDAAKSEHEKEFAAMHAKHKEFKENVFKYHDNLFKAMGVPSVEPVQ